MRRFLKSEKIDQIDNDFFSFLVLHNLRQLILCNDPVIINVKEVEAEPNLVLLCGLLDGGEEGHEVIKCYSA